MKSNIFKTLVIGASAMALVSCDENDWNKDELDGFKEPTITDVTTVQYSMTAADIKKLCSMQANIKIATENNQLAELSAVAEQGYFTDVITPEIYAPAWLDSIGEVKGSPIYYLSDRSTLQLSFPTSDGLPSELTKITSAPVMKVSEAQYQQVWGSETDFTEAFTPSHQAAKELPKLLKEAYPDAASGDYVVVTYNQANQDPIFGSGSDVPGFEMSSVIAGYKKGDAADVNGVVAAVCKSAFILRDKSGEILVYDKNQDYSSLLIGTEVNVKGTIGTFNGGLQIGSPTFKVMGEEKFAYNKPVTDLATIEAQGDKYINGLKTGVLPIYVKLPVTVKVSGTYYNFDFGSSKFTGSLYEATDALKAMFKDGEQATIEGYFITVSGKQSPYYANMLITSVNGQAVVPNAVGFKMTNAIADLKVKDSANVNGIVTGICAQGFIVKDLSGEILAYAGKTFDGSGLKIGSQVNVTGTVGYFNGGLQIGSPVFEVEGGEKYVYGIPVTDVAAVEAQAQKFVDSNSAETGVLPMYVSLKATVSVSGNYYNFAFGSTKYTGSIYQGTAAQKALLKDGEEATITGYFISSNGKFVNVLVTSINGKATEPEANAAAASLQMMSSRAGATLFTEELKAVYSFNGSSWSAAKDLTVLTAADYAQMGVSSNINATQAANYLPIYFKNTYPYAQADEAKYVVYDFYNGSATVKNYVSRGVYDGSAWNVSTINTKMNQFVRAGQDNGGYNWLYDPTVYITLEAGRGASSAPFWQKCTDWVFYNIDVPDFGAPEDNIKCGIGYVTTFGNNEYYAGTSAYQCNVDLRPTAAKAQTPSVYGSMSDDEIVATLKKNFEERVMPAVMGQEYPDAMPGEKVDQFYAVTFKYYTGSTLEAVIRLKVVAKGTFKFEDCTWNEK